jgi:excinuclease ABC subunit C
MVVFENGKAKKSDYRRFRIKTVEGPNDYGSLQEVILRRFKRISDESQVQRNDNSFLRMPDLLLLDGGEKQVKAVKDVLSALKIDIPVAGMVKDQKHRTRDIIFNGKELEIRKDKDVFVFISEIQEEAHRFAITYHKSLRGKTMVHSVLDEIEGIGPLRKSALLRHFGSVEKIINASLEELCQVEEMNKTAARNILAFFKEKEY